ncbi:helix-turn-helix domain-containing protein [Streptomyces werraensis]|uniref:helix-turn-helix domain-containing protein n=1 Tax=Streptomyces werraensis TaxID=68284 RepID=UPI0036A2D753
MGHIAGHLAEDLAPAALAARAGVSPRHLTRLFTAHLGTTPARAVRVARTEAAAHLVRSSGLSMAAIARCCGFATTTGSRGDRFAGCRTCRLRASRRGRRLPGHAAFHSTRRSNSPSNTTGSPLRLRKRRSRQYPTEGKSTAVAGRLAGVAEVAERQAPPASPPPDPPPGSVTTSGVVTSHQHFRPE